LTGFGYLTGADQSGRRIPMNKLTIATEGFAAVLTIAVAALAAVSGGSAADLLAVFGGPAGILASTLLG
jgi:hypothetical protein